MCSMLTTATEYILLEEEFQSASYNNLTMAKLYNSS